MKKYHELIKPIVLDHGFKRKRNVYYRVVNDVLQNFCFEKVCSGRECRVRFCVAPLACRLSEVGIGLDCLKSFDTSETSMSPNTWDSWEYDRNEPKSIDACIAEIVRYLKIYLIPYFERADSCQTALLELIGFDIRKNEQRITLLNRCGGQDRADILSVLNLYDGCKYYMALKNKNYEFVLLCHKAILKSAMEGYEYAKSVDMEEESLNERKEAIARLKYEERKLLERDDEYFSKIIWENEEYSRKMLGL